MFRKENLKSLAVILTVMLVFSIFIIANSAIINAAAAWAPNTYYAVGATVTYNGSDYRCIQAHTSLVGWEPPNVPALWQLLGPSGSSSPVATPTTTKTPTKTPTPSSGSGAIFYQDINYAGTATQVIPPGSYTLSQLQSYGFVNDWASSCKTGGYTVIMYADDNFAGTSWTLSSDTANFVNLSPNANDLVTSVKIQTGGVTPGVTPTPTTTPTPSSGGSNSVYSVAYSSIPAPGSSGGVSFTLLNGTNGAYSNSQVYWGVLGLSPSTGKWCYLDLNGNLQPISNALNDAAGHLTKNGQNYANIYHTIAEKQWITIPQITSGRMYLSVGSPCYIKTYDTGFAGPDINNPTDPNLNVYFDFIEFTINGSGYHGNTTRVDGFGFPIQHRLVNNGGSYDRAVGELESETRAGLFTKYQNEVPTQFKSLGTDQQPYRIIAPIHGSFKAGGANANYFAGYTSISTQDVFMGVGGAADPGTCAAINRHVYTDSNWNIVANYYKAAPANYYAKFWHDHSISALAYGFCYDDVNGQAAYLEVGSPKGLIIRVGW